MHICDRSSKLCLGVMLAAWCLWVPDAFAQDSSGPAVSPNAPAAEATGVETYWTPERLRDARAPELPTPTRIGPGGLPEGAQLEGPQVEPSRKPGDVERGAGGRPTIPVEESLQRQLFIPQANTGVQPEATSSYGAYFTTSRVFPATVLTTYPYSAAGKLFFTDPRSGRNSVCSAAVLRPRIVVTAGHCVTRPSSDPAQRYFYTNFLFVPAFDNGSAPFGTWTSGQQFVLNAWHHSNGSVPNAGDIAFLLINDRNVSGQNRRIGEVTGWFGYAVNSLSKNHVTMLGYPCNLDSCARMQVTHAGSFAASGNNTYVYGSASRGGHSGGGWFQDFGVNPTSNPNVLLGQNLLVGITSFGPVAAEPKYLGSSNLDANFVGVLQSACQASAGNC